MERERSGPWQSCASRFRFGDLGKRRQHRRFRGELKLRRRRQPMGSRPCGCLPNSQSIILTCMANGARQMASFDREGRDAIRRQWGDRDRRPRRWDRDLQRRRLHASFRRPDASPPRPASPSKIWRSRMIDGLRTRLVRFGVLSTLANKTMSRLIKIAQKRRAVRAPSIRSAQS